MTSSKRMHTSFIRILFCFILITLNITVYTQNPLGNQNLQDIKVENLTDKQIKNLVKKAEESGMTQQQLENAAILRGMPPGEVSKLKARIQEIQAGVPEENVIESRERVAEETLPTVDVFSNITIDSRDQETIRTEKQKQRVYGFSLFTSQNLTFEPSVNVPTPKNYQLGPGDEVIIDVWGASQENYQLEINPDGYIFINNLGPIYLNGMTIEKASKVIINRLKNIYSGLAGDKPNTWAMVTLGQLRSIKVNVVGEVSQPGTYTLPSLSTVFNALYLSGGPDVNGSFRNIKVYRDNEIVTSLDVYEFLLKGKQENNIRLHDQDIIFVDTYVKKVEIEGEVKRPMVYELKPNEKISDVIQYAGGFTDRAYENRVKIYRNADREKQLFDITSEHFASYELDNGDRIVVGQTLNRFENRVTIQGAVFREGEYEYKKGLTLKSLIDKADGLREDAYLASATIYRMNEKYDTEVISVDLQEIIHGTSPDITLQNEDIVKINSIFDLEQDLVIRILGEVQQPGVYDYNKNLTLDELIKLAGGLLESASLSKIEIARRIKDKDAVLPSPEIAQIYDVRINEDLKLENIDTAFILEPFDVVFVRKSPRYQQQKFVNIQGEVAFPGSYTLKNKNERISDLIWRAGGLTEDAYISGASLTRKVRIDEGERQRLIESIREEAEDSVKIEIENEKEVAIGIDLQNILNQPGSKYDLLLEEGDALEIPKKLETVRLSGALLYPVTVRYDKNKSFFRYISEAGGFAQDAKKNKVYVLYANGSVDRTNSYLGFIKDYPKIEPGAEIIVPRKPEREGLSTQEAISLGSALSSLSLVIVTIVNSIK